MKEECPNCGADLPRGALACPECGSDEETGWSEAAKSDALGLPDESFDYDEFVEREFESKDRIHPELHWFWWLVAAGLVVAFGLLWFRH